MGEGELSGYIEVCNKGQVVWTSKVFLWIKENQISQVREFSAFLYMGRCKSLGSLNSFLSYASRLSEANCLCFHLLSSSGLPVASGCSLIPAISHRCSFPSWVLWRAGITDDCDVLVYWHNRKYSIFQSFPLVRNSTDIWETFHDQFWCHGAGRLIPGQVKVFVDISLRVLVSGLDPLIDNERFSGSSVF